MDVDHSTFNAERMQAKEKKRVRRDSAKTKDHAPSGTLRMKFGIGCHLCFCRLIV